MPRGFLVVLIIALVLAGAAWAFLRVRKSRPELSGSPEATRLMRKILLELTPEKAGITLPSDRQVWGGAMDWTIPQGTTVTVISLLDGTASVYFSHGGGVIGGGHHEPSRQAALAFVEALEGCASGLSAGSIQDLPPANRVRLYALSESGLLQSEEMAVDAFEGSGHSLKPCYVAAHEVIAQIRLLSERQAVKK